MSWSSGSKALVGVAVAVVLGAGALTGCAPAESQAEPAPSQSTAPKNELPADIAEVLENPKRITAEDIAGYLPNELKSFATITVDEAPTPEMFAQQYVTVIDTWFNAGATTSEFAPFKSSGKSVYETAMSEKYDSYFTNGLFAEGVGVKNLKESHEHALTIYMASATIDSTKPYNLGQKFISSEVVDIGDKWFTVDVTLKTADNIEQSSAKEIIKRKNINTTTTSRIAVQNVDGVYKITNSETIN